MAATMPRICWPSSHRHAQSGWKQGRARQSRRLSVSLGTPIVALRACTEPRAPGAGCIDEAHKIIDRHQLAPMPVMAAKQRPQMRWSAGTRCRHLQSAVGGPAVVCHPAAELPPRVHTVTSIAILRDHDIKFREARAEFLFVTLNSTPLAGTLVILVKFRRHTWRNWQTPWRLHKPLFPPAKPGGNR